MTLNATRIAVSRPSVRPVNDAGFCANLSLPDSISLGRRAKRWIAHRFLRAFMLCYFAARSLSRVIGGLRRRRPHRDPCEILLTGTFYSENWVLAHIRPLAASKRCARLSVVTTFQFPDLPNVVAIYPPGWLTKLIGAVPARMFTFAWVAIRQRPDVMGGFHLLLNGLWAALLAPLVGARSLYFCVGGPAEVVDGGIWGENRVFGKMETPDPIVERRLIRAVAAFDLVITMGTGAIRFFRGRGIDTRFHVVSGGMDAGRFKPAAVEPDTDLIMVGRLAPIKRIDLFLRAFEQVAQKMPGATATIVGDGELRESLERLADELGIAEKVTFAGQQRDVYPWLRRAKIFVLTSDSEGLALSMAEAMLCGLPAVVSNVGDLSDLVEDGVNGFLVDGREPHFFADRMVELLGDASRYQEFSNAARARALRFDLPCVERQWDEILGNLGS